MADSISLPQILVTVLMQTVEDVAPKSKPDNLPHVMVKPSRLFSVQPGSDQEDWLIAVPYFWVVK